MTLRCLPFNVAFEKDDGCQKGIPPAVDCDDNKGDKRSPAIGREEEKYVRMTISPLQLMLLY
jgi:hypothetical protein